MFDSMKQAAKLAAALKDLPKIKARMEEVRLELAARTVSGESGGGVVVAVADGRLRVVSIEVQPALRAGLASGERQTHEDATALLVEAVNDALSKAQRMIAEHAHAAAQEMNLPLPEGLIEGLAR
ncbi:MAG TPA: YbaB/EbfC family nucleoid-associated protein [Phycisphaerales bacterium]|nr:YbaB/EbfC family nucleoid-associated protein [Phycisphaerales bacterium]HMP37672.1 YbaB/EbfC family nucleoid-associated protein [Phycisphaerales bacterium]